VIWGLEVDKVIGNVAAVSEWYLGWDVSTQVDGESESWVGDFDEVTELLATLQLYTPHDHIPSHRHIYQFCDEHSRHQIHPRGQQGIDHGTFPNITNHIFKKKVKTKLRISKLDSTVRYRAIYKKTHDIRMLALEFQFTCTLDFTIFQQHMQTCFTVIIHKIWLTLKLRR